MSTYSVPFAFILLVSSPFLISSARAQPGIDDDDNPYRHTKILDPEGRYKLEWLVNWEEERIYFNVTVETTGFVLIGLSKRDPNNINVTITDHLVGGVDWNGRPYFTDRHSDGNDGSSLVDVKSDLTLLAAKESRTHTFLSFSRPFVTCDSQDIPINDDGLDLLWAYGEQDLANPSTSDFVSNGVVPIYILDPDLTPRAIQEGRLTQPETQLVKGDVKVWTLRSSFNIPPKMTTYWCNIHKLSLSSKHHIIGFTLKINNETESNFHHSILYRCTAQNPSQVFEQFLTHPGEECYSQDRQLGQIPFQSCTEAKGGVAIGGRSVFLPEVMGIPIGATGQSEYYLWQIHYDNPMSRDDLKAVIEFDVYYTSKLRPHDGGFTNMGHNTPGSPSILVPPQEKNHMIYGHCSPVCTRRMLPPEGIKIVAGLLITFSSARGMTVQHFRNNVELPYILKDQNKRSDFHPTRVLRKEVTILPGDQVTTRCTMDTTAQNRSMVGGHGLSNGICLVFVYYYNLLEDFTLCQSLITSPEYTARYLAGTRNLTWDQSRLEYVATDPPHLAGMTVSEISDSPYVNWSTEQRASLQRDHILHPQMVICPNTRGGTSPPKFVSYPVEATEYRPHPRCSLI